MKDCMGSLKKVIRVLVRAPLLGSGVTTYFLYKKIRKINTNYVIKIFRMSLIK